VQDIDIVTTHHKYEAIYGLPISVVVTEYLASDRFSMHYCIDVATCVCVIHRVRKSGVTI